MRFHCSKQILVSLVDEQSFYLVYTEARNLR